MRQLLTGLAAASLLLPAIPARAQQGSVQLTAAGQVVTGDPQRLAGQNQVEPDLALTWLQPGKRFGIFELEVRSARRGNEPHLGRVHVAFRDVKAHGVAWTLEGGDSYFSPAIGEYRLTNLFTPAVMFTGASIGARTAKSSLTLVAGRASAWRNIFGTDPDTLGQTIGLARVTHRFGDRLEFNARASRIRTTDLEEFSYTIDASDQAGGGMRLAVTPELHLAADATAVSYRRAGASAWEHDPSYMFGASWLHRRGWVQVNASHFSPGDFPVLNYALQDREGIFAAGDIDAFPRVRLSGGWDAFRTNVEPAGSLASSRPPPRSEGQRQFAGVRVQLWSRSTFTLRAEQGDRRSRPTRFGALQDSDTGTWTAEWQTAFGRVNSFARYARRENVDHVNAPSSYDQHDASALAFINVTRGTQLFGTVMFTRSDTGLSSTTYWQSGGGVQLQVPRHDLWFRAEGTIARNIDLLTQSFVPREALTVGLNGQLTRNLSIGFNINVDRSPMPFSSGSPWLTRSLFRVVRTLPTGSAYSPTAATFSEATAGRGTGAIVGSVFADWNANGFPDAGEETLEGIPMRVTAGAATRTGRDGQFSFMSVPAGLREVGLDPGAIPIDFDPPAATSVQLDLARGDTRRVTFGLIPLGSIDGSVLRDANGNGKLDAGDEPVEGAVVILNGGARSEQARRGRYRFDAVRGGEHTVKLLIESLPGAQTAGPDEVKVALVRGQMSAAVGFLVSIEKRPEIRKVFPQKGGNAAAAGGAKPAGTAPAGRGAGANAPPRAVRAATPGSAPARGRSGVVRASAQPGLYTIQVAALSDLDKAREVAIRLSVSGLPAYLVEPGVGDALYRVRVGPYGTRADAQKVATELEGLLGVKLWVTREAQ